MADGGSFELPIPLRVCRSSNSGSGGREDVRSVSPTISALSQFFQESQDLPLKGDNIPNEVLCARKRGHRAQRLAFALSGDRGELIADLIEPGYDIGLCPLVRDGTRLSNSANGVAEMYSR